MSFTSNQPLLVNQLPLSVDFPKDQDKFLEVITEIYKRIANSVNTKEGGLYSLQELFNSIQYFTPNNPNNFRNAYRKTFDVVALNGTPIPPAGVVTFPHQIMGIKSATHIYASCTSTDPQYFTVVYPYVILDNDNFIFTNPLPSTSLTTVYLIAEYLKT